MQVQARTKLKTNHVGDATQCVRVGAYGFYRTYMNLFIETAIVTRDEYSDGRRLDMVKEIQLR